MIFPCSGAILSLFSETLLFLGDIIRKRMSTDIVSYIPTLSGWGIVGFAVGFVAKKIVKYLLILTGLYFATLIYLQQQGWISINRNIGGSVNGLIAVLYERITGLWSAASVSLPMFGAFGAGAYLGFRKG